MYSVIYDVFGREITIHTVTTTYVTKPYFSHGTSTEMVYSRECERETTCECE